MSLDLNSAKTVTHLESIQSTLSQALQASQADRAVLNTNIRALSELIGEVTVELRRARIAREAKERQDAADKEAAEQAQKDSEKRYSGWSWRR